ncbi:hypothetical protein D4Q52_02470 [Rhodopseudomonas palustris]|uniref:Uncharacterized protein n=1 Tax=Rhodopseudomonas palustris TaxID=1076 RepID=A0A418VNQ1_RHOPL|nr:hypothetical protein D4Q52_02470 [Rhodopseudomonas palustris]
MTTCKVAFHGSNFRPRLSEPASKRGPEFTAILQSARFSKKLRHGRACPGHPRLLCISVSKAWMPGTRPGMTCGGGSARLQRAHVLPRFSEDASSEIAVLNDR